MKLTGQLPRWMEEALWAGDLDALNERAGCRCCCWEHTFANCPARLWDGCRGGQGEALAQLDAADEWAAHYERFHGMSRERFFGGD